MFVGHYAVSLVVKSREPRIPLWQLFLAVQFVDILFFSFSFFGIESFNIVPDYTASTHFELVYMPYTHGLVALGLALAVVSHWVLDFIVHTPDMPLLGNDSLKVGLGLWHYSVATYILEATLLAAGAWYLLKDDFSDRTKHRVAGFVVVLLVINAGNIFGPAGDASETTLAIAALAAYFGFAGVAYWAVDG